MDTAGSLFTGLVTASIITTGGLVINLTENFGTLSNNQSVLQEADGNRLVGAYGNAVTGMSAVTVGLSGLYLIFFIYGWYQTRGKKASLNRVYYTVLLLAVLLGIAAAGMNLNMTQNYFSIDTIVPSPDPPVAGENYKLRGSYGVAELTMASLSLAFASIGWLWQMKMWSVGDIETTFVHDTLGGSRLGSSRSKHMLSFAAVPL